jgi:protein TonB
MESSMRYFLLASITVHAALFAAWPAHDVPSRSGGPLQLSVLIDNDVIPQNPTPGKLQEIRHVETVEAPDRPDRQHTMDNPDTAPSTTDKHAANQPETIAITETGASVSDADQDKSHLPAQTTLHTLTGTQILANLKDAFLPYFTYPRLARIKGWQGTVELTVNLDAQGQLTAARIVHSSGYGILDHAALESIRRVKIVPNAVQWLNNHGLEVNFPVIYQLVDS